MFRLIYTEHNALEAIMSDFSGNRKKHPCKFNIFKKTYKLGAGDDNADTN